MPLVKNRRILKQRFPDTWNILNEIEEDTEQNFLQIEETRRENKTLFINKDGKTTYFHSKYNPLREADAIVDEYKDVKEDTNVIFYGTGLGYHIDSFLEKYPNVNYCIYEPIPELLYTYLSYKPIKDLPSKNLMSIVMGIEEQKITKLLKQFINKNRGNILLVELPIHKQIFSQEYENFLSLFKRMIKSKRSKLHTDYAFQKRWIINSMKNFSDVISTPNIIMGNKEKFKGKPAILVAAGPSLNEEIENIRYIKENGLAYIFSVGSAINTLIYHDIYPDCICTYDPKETNQKVIAKVKEKGISDIPMIFGSSVGYETLEEYPGEKYHMLTSQDTIANYFLRTVDNEKIDMVLDAPSIAVVTMQLLYTLGFGPIVLVGQNLAYRGKERHSEGVYYSSEVTEKEMDNGIWVKDVYDNEVLTNEGFNSMREQMELYIKEFPNLEVINTTKDGAHIEGTTFMKLDKVMNKYLDAKVYEENWLKEMETNYNKEYLKDQLEKMDRAYNRALKLTDEYYDILNKIDRTINNRNFKQNEKMYIKLDKTLGKIERNVFFKTFILPMNRVQYKILADSIDSFNEEKNPIVKGKRIVGGFKKFMDICKNDIDIVEPIYKEMKEKIVKGVGD